MREVIAEQVVDLIVLDLRLKAEDGMALARTLRDESAIRSSCSRVARKRPIA